MTDIASLRMAVDTGEVRRANAELDKLERAAGRNAGAADALAGVYGKLGGALAALGLAAQAGGALRLADAYASMNARLALATRGTAEFARAQRELFAIAQETGIGLGETSDLYASLARSVEALGLTQTDVLGITKTINQTLAISGTSATSAAAALVQLNQAFASGVLRGEELNSILEQAPALARAIADGLGVPVGQLRRLGEEGALTAEKVSAALLKSGVTVNAQFSQLPLTVSRATTQAGNSLLQFVGRMDELTGASGGLASAIAGASRSVDDFGESLARAARGDTGAGALAEAIVTASEAIRVFGADVSFVFGGVGREIGAVLAQMTLLYEVLRAPPGEVLQTARRNWSQWDAISQAVKADGERARAELDRLTARVLSRNAAGTSRAGQGRGDFEGYPRAPEAPLPPVKPPTGGRKADPYGDELRSLRERLALLGANSEAERVLTEAALGKFGRLTPAQRAELQALAEAIDAREQYTKALEEEASAREAAGRLAQAALSSTLAETDRLIDGNQALRDEIALLGATEEAKLAVEVARVSSARVLLEERAAMLANAGATDAEIQALQQQINLLREREGLLVQRFDRQKFLAPLEDTAGVAKKAGTDTYTEVRDALSAAFRDTSNPIRAFANALGNAVFTRVTASLADAMALQLVGSTGSGGLLGSALGALGSIFGGSPIVPFGGTTGDFARFDRRMATGTNYVPYDGFKATLHEGEAVVPKRYNPAAGGSLTGAPRVTYSPTTVIQVDARSDQAQVQRIAAAAAAEANRRQAEQLRAMGVL